MMLEGAGSARDYTTISPSALSLLLLKSKLRIPFAQRASELLWPNSPPDALMRALTQDNAQRRMKHFEIRYHSLDTLLAEAALPRVLEIGGGLSFRGLELARTSDTFYVDTDLPDIIQLKSELVAKLHPAPLVGTLRVQALDALDSDAFDTTVDGVPRGPLAIANEGLLMYLDEDEKACLAANVRKALLARGGVWLTADVYIRNSRPDPASFTNQASREFLKRHGVEEKKFVDFDAATKFFSENGFEITRRLGHERADRIRESWALRARQ
jgi:O-methyltransferase involved in polyketide biosynthesis